MIEDFLNEIKNIGFNIKESKNGQIKLFLDCCHSWTINLIPIENETFLPLIYFRKIRIEEVTDLNDIIPAIVSSFFKIFSNSSIRILGEHNEFSMIEDELYGMYIIPSQPLSEKVRLNSEDDRKVFYGILECLLFFNAFQGDILGYKENHADDFITSSKNLNVWVNIILSSWDKAPSYVSNIRVNPDWFYFRSYSEGLTVCRSPKIARLLKYVYDTSKNDIKYLDGINSKIVIQENLKNTISDNSKNLISKLLYNLNDKSEYIAIAQENFIIFVSDNHLLIKYEDSGHVSFLKEKELILNRQKEEIKLLFSDEKIKWTINTKQDSAIFEDLVLELLNREPSIISTKKVAPTNQPDNGRDLICEYNKLHRKNIINKGEPSIDIGKMIVQCKTNLTHSKKSSIGKADVDVANTILDYDPDGYLLVVNTQVTRDLTEMLEKLKDRNLIQKLDWWNAFDVEERLRKNPDIMNRYSNIVQSVART